MDLRLARELSIYNAWANTRVLDSVAGLDLGEFTRPMGGSYPSVQATLTHILWAEWIWLERWKGGSPKQMFVPEEFPSVSTLKARWSQVQAAQVAFLESVVPEQLQRMVRYTNLKGDVWEYPLWRQIYHVFNHSSYHRGQITNMLRLLGAEPRATDFLIFWDEGGSVNAAEQGDEADEAR